MTAHPALAAACLLVGCASRGGAPPAVAAAPVASSAHGGELGAPRRGLGVAVDPVLELPAALSAGATSSGLVVLTAPVDVRPALRVVAEFFEAVSIESPESLEQLFDRAAHVRSSAKARPEAALPAWRRRFDRLDYTPLSTEVIYRAADVKVNSAADAAASGGRSLPVVLKGEEVLVRVFPVGQAAAKLFGTEIDFVLKPSSGTYKITDMLEDFRLP